MNVVIFYVLSNRFVRKVNAFQPASIVEPISFVWTGCVLTSVPTWDVQMDVSMENAWVNKKQCLYARIIWIVGINRPVTKEYAKTFAWQ